jgi:hypothetical protein
VTAAVIGLIASYAVLAVLLLSLNLRSAWHWTIKAVAIVLTSGFFVVAFLALQELLGWPTQAPPPARFQLHAALVVEPDRERPDGVIFLWLSPQTDDGEVAGPPRAHALPYSRALHEQTERARARIEEGAPVEGTARRGEQPGYDSMQVELFEGPRPVLPPKTG